MQRRIFKEMERQAIVQFGYDPKKGKQKERRRHQAEEWQVDPLHGFPYDIDYLTQEQIKQKVSVSKRFWDKMISEKRWDKERAIACMGKNGIVAKRCSMNDKLWKIYRESKARNVIINLDEIKKMIMIDIKRSKLYPSGWTDSDASPPEWYLDQLREKGLLDKIFQEIDEVTKMGVA